MEPFTYDWWDRMRLEAQREENIGADLLDATRGEAGAEHANRYLALGNWIDKRIITKYGEQNETTKKRH